MILLLGAHSDDLLYCTSLLSNKKEEPFLGGLTLLSGRIFSQEVLILDGIYTNTLASAVTSALFLKYHISLVFVLGKCYSVNENLPRGKIIVSRQVLGLDTDVVEVANTKVSTVPGFPSFFKTQLDLIGYVSQGFTRRTRTTCSPTDIYSSDSLSSLSVENAIKNKGALGSTERFAIDTNSFGVALSCYLHDVPFISVKAVERDIADYKKIEDYVDLLSRYVDIGKAVVYTIGDIGRNDVLRMRRK